MNIHVFAALKDFMPSEWKLTETSVKTIKDLKEYLKVTYPAAENLLEACRFSTDVQMLSLDQEIKNYENIFVIPPSSGG
ncbi:MoaD/ThiS family protein [Cytophaga aurantiaca]|uniref:MoaD/ThiS family protein n=1 Tax=Cytophaga aurantiaca TaxID=29530 RepID=UPI00035FA783|nr:MoaD/ThiS family protein [Cytophaga aurantiaca]